MSPVRPDDVTGHNVRMSHWSCWRCHQIIRGDVSESGGAISRLVMSHPSRLPCTGVRTSEVGPTVTEAPLLRCPSFQSDSVGKAGACPGAPRSAREARRQNDPSVVRDTSGPRPGPSKVSLPTAGESFGVLKLNPSLRGPPASHRRGVRGEEAAHPPCHTRAPPPPGTRGRAPRDRPPGRAVTHRGEPAHCPASRRRGACGVAGRRWEAGQGLRRGLGPHRKVQCQGGSEVAGTVEPQFGSHPGRRAPQWPPAPHFPYLHTPAPR